VKKRKPAISIGLIETMRYEDGCIFFLHEHLRRLEAGCRVLGLRLPSRRAVQGALGVLVRHSPLVRARLRVVWSRQDGAMRLAVISYPLAAAPAAGFSVMVERRRKLSASRLTALKTTQRTFYEALYARARQRGFDEALFFNTRDELAEGTRTNVFLVREGRLVTPPLGCGCLAGVTRQQVIRCARRLKIPVLEKKLTKKDLACCEELFVTNAVIGIMPVREAGRRKIPGPLPGPVTRRLGMFYRKAVEAKSIPV